MTNPAPTRASAADRISTAYAKHDPHEHLGKRLAQSFRYDATYERLAALKASDPAGWHALPAGTHIEVGHYLAARAAADALGIDITAPSASTP